MLTHARHHRRTLIVVAAAFLVGAVPIGVGTIGLLHAPATHPSRTAARVTAAPSPTAAETPSTAASVAPVAGSTNAEVFARRIAAAIFDWDTTQPWQPTDYMQAIVDAGDPTGQETAGLASDLTAYYPTTAQWDQLRDYRTRQWLTIRTAAVPAAWAQAVREAHGSLRPGTTAYTITGIRHRAGVWDGKPASSGGSVSFTVFETCRPGFPSCRLLRLSQPDAPLR